MAKQLRVGTRGSELALWQTRWVSARLRALFPEMRIEEVIIKTHGDTATSQLFDQDWPAGGFVGAIEQALLRGEVDFAVHSHKDLPTAETAGLCIAAVPAREPAGDVLLTRRPVSLDALPAGFRLGTSSPRRAAQFRRLGRVEIVPIRGNVPTRVAKLERENLDGVVLAAAGLGRLGIEHPYKINLPVERFVPAPAQGALAIQARAGDAAADGLRRLNDDPTRRRVAAERAFLQRIEAGCHVPVGAHATASGSAVTLRAQLFSDDGGRMAEGILTGEEPAAIGIALADRLKHELCG